MVNRKPEMLMGVMLLVFVFLISRHAGMMVSGQNVVAGREKPVVVIDSGHPTYHLCNFSGEMWGAFMRLYLVHLLLIDLMLLLH